MIRCFFAVGLVCCAAVSGGADVDGEYAALVQQMEQFGANVPAQARLRAEVLHPAALIDDGDRDPVDVVLRRTAVLLDAIAAMPGAPDLAAVRGDWTALAASCARTEPGTAQRKALFAQACGLRRRIAFMNPLLDFDRIIFLKHDRARYEHMVDQYYGFHAAPRGGVFVLDDAFGDAPVARDVLADAHVAGGRLQGRTLQGGAFISLELDYDAQTILFAWSEAQVPVPPQDLTPMADLWTPGSTYHIFKAAVDGSSVVQLTDGCVNDFDPCVLPGGRIAFISERRGGFLRCGLRPNPTYTLHSMRADGSDIIRLSHHETHEWHPSVDNNGMIVFSRWDYVDRDSDIAHHLWLTYPDGRDPRTSHGNYPPVREMRPWMELSIRAVPASAKYVAVSAPHHGQNYGSLVLVDPRLADDGAMAQIKRITPEVAFPESEVAPGTPCETHGGRNNRKSEVYGTPWPLSEQFYLCVHDTGQRNYALCLVDAFGNREVLYRDPEIACLDPIPLRPRPHPPVIPAMTCQAAEDKAPGKDETGRLAIANIYDSDFEWPTGTRIKELRIIQIYPKTTPGQEDPMIGIGAQSLARGVLGTAPVEPDGSVYCEVPVGVPVYFQAVDERGRASQTMMSDTYLHPGETLTCRGCHESKQNAPAGGDSPTPLALQRPPSRLRSEGEGSLPVLYSRLVQPVLDRHCLACHRKESKAPSLEATTSGKRGWSESYQTLAPRAWAQHGGNGALENGTSRSVAGHIGANASRLMKMLDAGHHDVRLPAEDLRRLTLWIDCNSVFYADYHGMETQARGEAAVPAVQ